ncbi:MAG: isochorismatase family cysteine hydrolase [Solirubrobacteraceae bacterium]
MSATALIVVDMLNHYEHEDAETLRRSVRETLPAIQDLVQRASDADVPIVYVNDNHGDWSAGRPELCRRALEGPDPSLVEPIIPSERAAFLVKARHSIFYETQLDYMLRHQDIERIVLIGQVTEQCILYSALDAYVRHYSIVIPHDAVAHIHQDLADAALRMMETNMGGEITTATQCDLTADDRRLAPSDPL